MANDASGAAGAPTPMPRIEHLMSRYSQLTDTERDELLHWYRKEASAHDIGTLAMRQDIREEYRRFRADHIDRLRPADIVKALAVVAAFVMIAAVVVYLTR